MKKITAFDWINNLVKSEDLYENWNTLNEDDSVPFGIDILFAKKYDNMVVKTSLMDAFASVKTPISVNNLAQLKASVYDVFIKKVNSRLDFKANKKNISKIIQLAGLKTPKGLQIMIVENSVFLASQGFKMQNILLDVKRGRKTKEKTVDAETRSRYSAGEEIDLDYNGDGHEAFDNQIVVRSQHGETPMMLYGFNGPYSSQVCNEIRAIYAADTGADYYYCSGISLHKWKECNDVRKRCCDRNGELYDE